VFVLLTTVLTSSVPPQFWQSPVVIALWAVFGIVLILCVVQQYSALFTTVEDRIFPGQYLQSKDMILLFICTSCGGAVEGVTLYCIPLFISFTHGDLSIKVTVRRLPFVVVFIVFFIIAGALLPTTGRYAPTYTLGRILLLVFSSLFFTISETTYTSAIYGYEALVGARTGLVFQNAYAIVTRKVIITRKVERYRKPRVSSMWRSWGLSWSLLGSRRAFSRMWVLLLSGMRWAGLRFRSLILSRLCRARTRVQ
jgi:hypothetical protein